MKDALRKATESWLEEFNTVPGTVIEKMAEADQAMYSYDSDSLRLIASPRIKCSACSKTYNGKLSLSALTKRSAPCRHCRQAGAWGLDGSRIAFPCGWDTLFAPCEVCDLRWFDEHRDEVANLGFFVFENEDYGLFLGIDDLGLNAYEAYWLPLYLLRHLRR